MSAYIVTTGFVNVCIVFAAYRNLEFHLASICYFNVSFHHI